MDKTDIKIDWGDFHPDPEFEKLCQPKFDTHEHIRKMAHDIERNMFLFMTEKRIKKIYVVREFVHDPPMTPNSLEWNGTSRFDMWLSEELPLGHECTEHDFSNLLEMIDSEFENLLQKCSQYDDNGIYVKMWREEMLKGENDG